MILGEQRRQLLTDLAQMQRKNDAVLGEQTTDLVAELRAEQNASPAG
jgi:hypothetical protein